MSIAEVYYNLRFLFTALNNTFNWVTDLETNKQKNAFKTYNLRMPVISCLDVLKLNYNMI